MLVAKKTVSDNAEVRLPKSQASVARRHQVDRPRSRVETPTRLG
jgi:hypothetical protein